MQPLAQKQGSPDEIVGITRRLLESQGSHYQKRAIQLKRTGKVITDIAIVSALTTPAIILAHVPDAFAIPLPALTLSLLLWSRIGQHQKKEALLEYSHLQAGLLTQEAETLSRLVEGQLISMEAAKSVHDAIVNEMWTLPARRVLYPKGEPYHRISLEEGEEAAILSNIVRDSNTPEATAEDFVETRNLSQD